jgi:hypothetical protein
MRASLRLQAALDDPCCHLEAACQLVLAEPLIAARVVAIGNSVAYTRYGARVSNVNTALKLLGFRTLRSLVAFIVVRQFSSAITAPALRDVADRLWQHSAHVAAIANVIARHGVRIDPDTAMFAGIVHEIGGFYLLSRADEFPELLPAEPVGGAATAELELARGVLRALLVPKMVVAAVESLWTGGGSLPPATVGDVLALANELAPVASPLLGRIGSGLAAEATVIDCVIRDTTLREIMAASADEIRSLTDALLA